MSGTLRRARLAVAVAALLVVLHGLLALFVPAGDGNLKLVDISPGSSVRQIARLLKRSKIIKNELYFTVLARLLHPSLKAGEYGFRRSSMWNVMSTIAGGRVYLHRVLVREGDSVAQIAEAVSMEGLAGVSSFVAATRNQALISSLGIKEKSAEGYLFPDTYMLQKGIVPEDIVRVMVRRFLEKVPEGLVAAAGKNGLSRSGWVTLASIVEKEARVPEERRIIAGVFINRLLKGMRLQADPTVWYALGRWDRKLTYADLLVNHPYNTYRHAGLPPGPICSPGLDCLEAAANPAKVPYLFFVTRKDGSGRHDFTVTLEAHERADRKSKEREKKPEVAGK